MPLSWCWTPSSLTSWSVSHPLCKQLQVGRMNHNTVALYNTQRTCIEAVNELSFPVPGACFVHGSFWGGSTAMATAQAMCMNPGSWPKEVLSFAGSLLPKPHSCGATLPAPSMLLPSTSVVTQRTPFWQANPTWQLSPVVQTAGQRAGETEQKHRPIPTAFLRQIIFQRV